MPNSASFAPTLREFFFGIEQRNHTLGRLCSLSVCSFVADCVRCAIELPAADERMNAFAPNAMRAPIEANLSRRVWLGEGKMSTFR